MTTLDVLRDQLEQVDRDLADVGAQVADRELDETTADRLRTTYLRERHELERRISEMEGREGDGAAAGPDRRRIALGAGIIAVALTVVGVVLINTVQDRAPGDLATGGVASDVAAGTVDLAGVTNDEMEAVVAENPDVVPMRLALAGRYFEEGDFQRALPHYMTVLEQDPDNPEALANLGWMTYLSDPTRADVAATFVERALDSAPDFAQAYWFLGHIRLYGLDDAAGAIEPLERLLLFDGLPDDVREQAETALQEARP
jgi:cytochrome c-type biogenesis protein CcmH/NrfG